MLQRLRPLARWPGACSGAVLGVQTCMLPASLSAAAGLVRIAPVAPPAAGGGAGWPRSGQTEGGSAGPRPVARHFFPLTSYFYSAPSDEGAVSRRLTEGEIPPGLQVCARRTNGAGAKTARSKFFSLLKARQYLSFRRYRGTSLVRGRRVLTEAGACPFSLAAARPASSPAGGEGATGGVRCRKPRRLCDGPPSVPFGDSSPSRGRFAKVRSKSEE